MAILRGAEGLIFLELGEGPIALLKLGLLHRRSRRQAAMMMMMMQMMVIWTSATTMEILAKLSKADGQI